MTTFILLLLIQSHRSTDRALTYSRAAATTRDNKKPKTTPNFVFFHRQIHEGPPTFYLLRMKRNKGPSRQRTSSSLVWSTTTTERAAAEAVGPSDHPSKLLSIEWKLDMRIDRTGTVNDWIRFLALADSPQNGSIVGDSFTFYPSI